MESFYTPGKYLNKNFVFISGSDKARIGSSRDEIEKAISFWKDRLISPCFTEEKFRTWLEKEYPLHFESVPSYFIAKYPVTNKQYRNYLQYTNNEQEIPKSLSQNEPSNHPVWGTSVNMCNNYCKFIERLLKQAGIDVLVNLPTESQWEYAARGNTNNLYPYGNTFDSDLANTFESGIGKTTPVDYYSQNPSPFGVFDLAGNVEEWTCSLYRPYPGGQKICDDLSEHHQEYYVLRGGSFVFGGDVCRCSRRHGPHPDPEFLYAGFRPVLNLPNREDNPLSEKKIIDLYFQQTSTKSTHTAIKSFEEASNLTTLL